MKKTTSVINLFAGPGTGKSTTAAGLFYEMKLRGYDVELVREYVKPFAYGHSIPSQPYIFAKQLKAETMVYGAVDWLITDSPLWLSTIYGDYSLFAPLCRPILLQRREYNFVLTRHKPYHQNGRWQTAQEAKDVDKKIKVSLLENNIPFVTIAAEDRERVSVILKELQL